MTWTFSDHTSPRETKGRCVNGCDKHHECQAKACNQDNLCEGHQYECADCGEAFCFGHVMDVNDDTRLDARYVCLTCVAKVVVLGRAA